MLSPKVAPPGIPVPAASSRTSSCVVPSHDVRGRPCASSLSKSALTRHINVRDLAMAPPPSIQPAAHDAATLLLDSAVSTGSRKMVGKMSLEAPKALLVGGSGRVPGNEGETAKARGESSKKQKTETVTVVTPVPGLLVPPRDTPLDSRAYTGPYNYSGFTQHPRMLSNLTFGHFHLFYTTLYHHSKQTQ